MSDSLQDPSNSPQTGSGLRSNVIDVLFIPAGVSYALVSVDWKLLGVANYLVFLAAAAYRRRLFAQFHTWPRISQLALLAGPLLISVGFIYPTQIAGYWAIFPIIPYVILCLIGASALTRVR